MEQQVANLTKLLLQERQRAANLETQLKHCTQARATVHESNEGHVVGLEAQRVTVSRAEYELLKLKAKCLDVVQASCVMFGSWVEGMHGSIPYIMVDT